MTPLCALLFYFRRVEFWSYSWNKGKLKWMTLQRDSVHSAFKEIKYQTTVLLPEKETILFAEGNCSLKITWPKNARLGPKKTWDPSSFLSSMKSLNLDKS